MKEIRFHGMRVPGKPAPFIETARLLALAALKEGKYVQLRPPWGFQRGYVPETAVLRVDHAPIEDSSQEYRIDLAVIEDPTLIEKGDYTSSLKDGATILINSERAPALSWTGEVRVADLTSIANGAGVDLSIPLAGATGRAIEVIGLASLEQVVRKTFTGERRKRSLAALRQGFEAV